MEKNKTGKYLKYAIGEIVLVVIGILIALQINNWNEERKLKLKTEHILSQIYNELAFNIDRANSVSRSYRQKAPLVYKVLHKEVTYNDYKTDRNYSYLIRSVPLANLKDKAFRNLNNLEAQLTEQQDSLYSELINLYEIEKINLDLEDDIAMERLVTYTEKIKDEKPWYYNYHVKNEITDEMIDYFLNDPTYLNEVTYYSRRNIGGHNGAALDFRNKAVKIYDQLSQYLNIPKDTVIIKDLSQYEHYIGIYTDSLNIVEIKREKEGYFYIRKTKIDSVERSRSMLYPETIDSFTVGGSFGYLTFFNNSVDSLVISIGLFRRNLKRINYNSE